jgi:hypothetical protein
MASIIKRNDKYKVVYYYTDEQGEQKQKWETFTNHKDAQKRKAEVEVEILNDTFIVPKSQTISAFLEDFVALYSQYPSGVEALAE